jgi:GT2 family glycosyltransferase
VDYSIVIPVFNKAEFTRNCLAKLQPSLAGAGEGEVIVIDNASSDHTAQVLRDFPWIRAIRNERNLGFSGANNQGAREASGKYLVLLNNDTEPITAWLAPMLRQAADPSVGAVGARLLFADRSIQHAGVVVRSAPFSAAGFVPYHYLFHAPEGEPESLRRRDCQVVTGACLVTPRELYLELGGLDEGFWNGYEDVDYCFKIRERGLRIVYEPDAMLFHFESQSGSQRFRRTQANVQRLSDRWRSRVEIDAPRTRVDAGVTEGIIRTRRGGMGTYALRTAPVDVLVHGTPADWDALEFEAELRANRSPVGRIVRTEAPELEAARELMRVRGERHVAFVRGDSQLEPGWLDELLARANSFTNAAAATFADGVPSGRHAPLLAGDARCTLLRLRNIPQHLELQAFDSFDASVADLLVRALQHDRCTVGAHPYGRLGAVQTDRSFSARYGMALGDVFNRDTVEIERVMRSRSAPKRGLVSIVTLSWNAPEFTKSALASIRAHTAEPYEVIVVDNGSGPPTRQMLAEIDDPHVRIVYNQTNRGFSGGNNDGIAHARGDFVILLNNDVIVTPGWVEGLVDPFRRIPALGISAPRSNLVTGDQQLADATYRDEHEMLAFAQQRRAEFSGKGYTTERAIGFCWCISRTVLDQIGALDERFSLGNFEDDDYCMRVRAAGYWIYVCDDVFIHHFGSRSFAANNVDYRASMNENWEKFARKWGYTGPLPAQGYNPAQAYGRGFDRSLHYIPFPAPRDLVPAAGPAPQRDGEARAIFGAAVRGEDDWTAVAQFVKRFARAFRLEDGVRLSIGAFAEPHAQTLATRVQRILEREGISIEKSADIDIADIESEEEWREQARAPRWVGIESIQDRSPSALRRIAEAAKR